MKRKIHSVFVRFLLLFTTITLIITAGAILPFHLVVTQRLTEQLIANNNNVFTFYSKGIDNEFSDLNQALLSLSLNTTVYKFCTLSPPEPSLTPDDISVFHSAKDTINNFKATNPLVEELILYSARNGYVISSNGRIAGLEAYKQSSWIAYLDDASVDQWYFTSEDASQGSVFLVKKAMALSPFNQGYFVLRLSIQPLLETVLQITPENGSVHQQLCLFASDGTPICFNTALSASELEQMRDCPDNTSVQINSTLITSYLSPYTGFKLVILNQMSSLLGPVQSMSLFALALTLTVLVIGFLLSYQFSRISYRPIRNTVDSLQMFASSGDKNEFDIIASAATHLQNDIENLKSALYLNNNSLRTQFLRNLFNGYTYDPPKLRKLLCAMGAEFSEDCYCVAIISIDDSTPFSPEKNYYELSLLKYGLLNILNEILDKNQFTHLCCDFSEENLVCLVNFASDSQQLFFDTIIHYQTTVVDALGISLSIGMGDIASSLMHSRLSYEHARSAINKRFLSGGGNIFFYEPANHAPAPIPAMEHYLDIPKTTNYLLSGDYEKVQNNFFQLGECIHQFKDVRSETLLFRLLHLTVELLEASKAAESDPDCYQKAYQMLSQIKTLDEYIVWAPAFLHDTCTPKTSEFVSPSTQHVDEMLAYIDAHFTEDLSLDIIADLFGLSKSYISTRLNQRLKMSLTSYLSQLRVEHSKKLLREQPHMKMQEVAENSGFNNLNSFFRTFKRIEGIPPAQYRKVHNS